MQKLEIVITAKNWSDAKKTLATVDIDEKSKINYRPIDGLFIVSVEKSEPITDEIYEKIKNDPCISIASDSESKLRSAEVLDKVYDVETQLRKLLLHVSDLVEVYFEIFGKHGKYTKDFVAKKAISKQDSIDPITSHLTLGEMKDILSTDLSWSGREITAKDLLDAVSGSTSLPELKNYLAAKVRPQPLWDVIAKNVLHSTTTWNEILNDLRVLKDFRDASAHYQVITEGQKKKLISMTNRLLPKITPPSRQPTKSELDMLNNISRVASENFAHFAELNARLYKNIMPLVDPKMFAFNNQLVEGLETIRNSLPKFDPSLYPSLYPALNTEEPKKSTKPDVSVPEKELQNDDTDSKPERDKNSNNNEGPEARRDQKPKNSQ